MIGNEMVKLVCFVVTIVAIPNLASAFNQYHLSHEQVTQIYGGYNYDQDIDSCSRFIHDLLKRSGWRGSSDEWRQAAIKLIEDIVTKPDLNGGLSIPADAKLLHCYKYTKEQNELLSGIKQARKSAETPISGRGDLRGLPRLNEGMDLMFPNFDWTSILESQPIDTAAMTVTFPKGIPQEASGVDGDKQKPKRGKLDDDTRLALEKAFVANPKPSGQEIRRLAKLYNKSRDFMYMWFYHRRVTEQRRNRREQMRLGATALDAPSADNPASTSMNQQSRPSSPQKIPKFTWMPREARIVFETLFKQDQYPSREMIAMLADQYGLDEAKIYNWFAAKRKRYKRTL